jgi:hypothetical protein
MKAELSPKAVRLAKAIALYRKGQDALFEVASEHGLNPHSQCVEDEMLARFFNLVLKGCGRSKRRAA